jgi:putative sterol carrier protein
MTAKDYLQGIVAKIKPEDLDGVDTNIHFELGSEKYTIAIKEGSAEFKEGLVGEGELGMTASPENFMKVAGGDLNPMMAMMSGKLKIKNPAAMMKYAKMLGLM